MRFLNDVSSADGLGVLLSSRIEFKAVATYFTVLLICFSCDSISWFEIPFSTTTNQIENSTGVQSILKTFKVLAFLWIENFQLRLDLKVDNSDLAKTYQNCMIRVFS